METNSVPFGLKAREGSWIEDTKCRATMSLSGICPVVGSVQVWSDGQVPYGIGVPVKDTDICPSLGAALQFPVG